MEKVLYFDCFAGICGDMTLAALVGLGVPEGRLRSELELLPLQGWSLRLKPDSRQGIQGIRADVELRPVPLRMTSRPLQPRSQTHGHRPYREIRGLIQDSGLTSGVKERALRIFAKLAEAEGAVHGMTADEVCFHEVGAVDSIIDIVGAAICLEYLRPDRFICSSVELGGGFVKCQHGLLPVPAPAVVELLKGVPVRSGAVRQETTTPTGAAILAAMVDEFNDNIQFRITRTAYGIGHRETEIPNVLRAYLGEREPALVSRLDSAGALLECNLDDMSPESHGHVLDRLFSAGADDVWLSPIVMKKNRSAVTLFAICGREREESVAEAMLRETSTFGLRRSYFTKTCLHREVREVETSLGIVRVKTGYWGEAVIKSKPEYEDLRRIAEEKDLSVIAVLDALRKEL